ncbi:MAG: hypothetical protein R3E83_11570 [Burkholderiaceae bacterium]
MIGEEWLLRDLRERIRDLREGPDGSGSMSSRMARAADCCG